MDTIKQLYDNLPDQDYYELMQYANEKYGIHQDNFIGMAAWARIELYERNDPGDGSGVYNAYLCNNVGLNRALQAEQAGNPSGWLNTMINGGYNGWGPIYQGARTWGSAGEAYQSSLKTIRLALDYHYPGITNCSGDASGSPIIYKWWQGSAGSWIYIW